MSSTSQKLIRRATYGPELRSPDYLIVRHIQEFTSKQLVKRLHPGMVVLDIGCGEQPLRSEVETAGARYVSADVVQNSTDTVDHLCLITQIPLPDGSIDFILCTEVLEHVGETEKAFTEMARVLKPEGLLLLTTPFLYPLHEEPHDFVRLTPHQIARCAGLAHFEILEMGKAGNEIEVVVSLFTSTASWFFKATSFRPARKLYAIAMVWTQAALNIVAAGAGRMFGKYFPQQAYLNTQCVLRRRNSVE